MRIGIDVRLWSESGVGRYIRNLVTHLHTIDTKNSYTLFHLSKDQEQIKKEISGKNWQCIPANIRWHSLEEQLRFPAILYNANVDIMHFPYFSVPIFYKRPYIVTIHDLILHHFPTGEASTLPLPIYKLKHLGYKQVISQAAKNAKKIITVSEATKKEILTNLSVKSEKVVVTYEAVETITVNAIKPKISAYFLYVGNAYPHKNLTFLIDAFLDLPQEGITLVLIGKDDYFYKRLQKKVQQQVIDKKIIFSGFVTDAQLYGFYQQAMAVVIPSLMEGFSLPTLEAMQNKTPVIASNIPAHREICDNAALYFDPTKKESLMSAMEAVIEKEQREKLIARGLKNILRFSWEKMAQETLSIYESAC